MVGIVFLEGVKGAIVWVSTLWPIATKLLGAVTGYLIARGQFYRSSSRCRVVPASFAGGVTFTWALASSRTHSLMHSLTHALTHVLTHSQTHSLTKTEPTAMSEGAKDMIGLDARVTSICAQRKRYSVTLLK
jgi:hypothetical protein